MDISVTAESQGKPEAPEDLLAAFAMNILPAIQEFYQTETGRIFYESFIRQHPELEGHDASEQWSNRELDDDF